MGFLSSLFSIGEKSAEQAAAEKFAIFMSKRRGLIIGLVRKRLEASGGVGAAEDELLQQLTDNNVDALPEAGIAIMTALYKKAIGVGASHQEALIIVNMTRVFPVQWDDVSKFENLQDYVMERLQVELAEADARRPLLRYFTREHVADCIEQTSLFF